MESKKPLTVLVHKFKKRFRSQMHRIHKDHKGDTDYVQIEVEALVE